MEKLLSVELLKLGDKFAFTTPQAEGTKPTVLIVTRAPAVNNIANSCHFRYRSDTDGADRKWDDNQSWNGTPGVRVRLLDGAAPPAPVAAVPSAPLDNAKPEKPTTQAKSVKRAVVAEQTKPTKRAAAAPRTKTVKAAKVTKRARAAKPAARTRKSK